MIMELGKLEGIPFVLLGQSRGRQVGSSLRSSINTTYSRAMSINGNSTSQSAHMSLEVFRIPTQAYWYLATGMKTTLALVRLLLMEALRSSTKEACGPALGSLRRSPNSSR